MHQHSALLLSQQVLCIQSYCFEIDWVVPDRFAASICQCECYSSPQLRRAPEQSHYSTLSFMVLLNRNKTFACWRSGHANTVIERDLSAKSWSCCLHPRAGEDGPTSLCDRCEMMQSAAQSPARSRWTSDCSSHFL